MNANCSRARSLSLLAGLACVALSAPAQDAVLARNLAATCANCHGSFGHHQGDTPSITGRPAQEIVGLLAAFKAEQRPSTVMHQIAKGYSDEQLALIAGYLAAQSAKR